MNSEFLPLSLKPSDAIRLLKSKLKPYQIGDRRVSVLMQLKVLDKIYRICQPKEDEPKRVCIASAKKLAEYLFCDDRTVRATINALVEQNLLIECKPQGYGREVFDRSVNLEKVREILSEEVIDERAECPPIECAVARPSNAQLPAHHRAECPPITGQSARLPIEPFKQPPPQTAIDGGGWDDVLKRVKAAGVARADEAIEAAMQAGHAPTEVDRLVSYFNDKQSQRNSPGAGLLFAWLTGSQPWPIIDSPIPIPAKRQTKESPTAEADRLIMAEGKRLRDAKVKGEEFNRRHQEFIEQLRESGYAIP